MTGFHSYFPQGLLFYALVALLCIYLFRARRRNRARILSSPYFFLVLIGFFTIRNTVWAFLALLPFAYRRETLTEEPEEARISERRILNLSIFSAFAILTLFMTPYLKKNVLFLLPKSKAPIYHESAPFDFTELIQNNSVHAPIFSDLEYTSFLELAQPNKVFFDIRNEIFSDEDYADYLTVLRANRNWESILDRYGVEFALLNKKADARLVSALQSAKQWKILGQNEEAVLFIKKQRKHPD